MQQIDLQMPGLEQGKIAKRNRVKVFNDGIAFRTISDAPAVTFQVTDGTGRWAQSRNQ